jgi:hypothetical protein
MFPSGSLNQAPRAPLSWSAIPSTVLTSKPASTGSAPTAPPGRRSRACRHRPIRRSPSSWSPSSPTSPPARWFRTCSRFAQAWQPDVIVREVMERLHRRRTARHLARLRRRQRLLGRRLAGDQLLPRQPVLRRRGLCPPPDRVRTAARPRPGRSVQVPPPVLHAEALGPAGPAGAGEHALPAARLRRAPRCIVAGLGGTLLGVRGGELVA